jgi:hypothetical protein
VPVTDAQGRVCATVAVHGPAPRVTLRSCMAFLPALRRAAAAMAGTMVPQAAAEPGVKTPAAKKPVKSRTAKPAPAATKRSSVAARA